MTGAYVGAAVFMLMLIGIIVWPGPKLIDKWSERLSKEAEARGRETLQTLKDIESNTHNSMLSKGYTHVGYVGKDKVYLKDEIIHNAVIWAKKLD